MNPRLTHLDDNALAQRLQRLSGDFGPSSAGTSRLMRVLHGVVAFDSGQDLHDAIRSAGALEGRQIVVESGGVLVVIDIVTRDSSFHAIGHVAGISGSVALQFLDDDERELGLGTTDEFDEFDIEVESEPAMLVLASDDCEIVVSLRNHAAAE